MKRISRQWFETEANIESRNPVTLRVDKQSPRPDELSGLKKPEDRVSQKKPTQAAPLLGSVDCQAAEKHDRNGLIAGQPLAQTRTGVSWLERSGGKGVIPDDLRS